MRRVALLLPFLLLALAASASAERHGASSESLVEVIVALDAEPLAVARPGRTLAATGGRRLSLSTTTSRAYLRSLATTQNALEARIEDALPQAEIRWRYRVVANGLAVVVPRDQVERLASVPGIARIYPSVRYTRLLDRGPQQIGAPALWGPTLSSAGKGSRSGSSTRGSTRRIRSSLPPATRCPPATPRVRRRTRPRR